MAWDRVVICLPGIFHLQDQIDIPRSGLGDAILVADSPTQDMLGKMDSRMTEVMNARHSLFRLQF